MSYAIRHSTSLQRKNPWDPQKSIETLQQLSSFQFLFRQKLSYSLTAMYRVVHIKNQNAGFTKAEPKDKLFFIPCYLLSILQEKSWQTKYCTDEKIKVCKYCDKYNIKVTKIRIGIFHILCYSLKEFLILQSCHTKPNIR